VSSKCRQQEKNNYFEFTLEIPVKNIYDMPAKYSNISLAAESLGCSRGYVYKNLKALKK
jgi:hypothetical protein